MLRGKSRNFCNFSFRKNIIFRNSHLFLPATYTLRVIIDVAPLINVWIFFATTPLSFPPALLNPIPHPFNIFSNLFEPNFFFIHIDSYTCKTLSNLVNFPFSNSCLGLVFTQRGQTDPILATFFKFHSIHFPSPFIKYQEKFHPNSLCLLSIWVNFKPNVYFLPPPSTGSISALTV